MAYPIKLFDFETEEGRKNSEIFLLDLDKTLTTWFGIIQVEEKIHKTMKIKSDATPQYLINIGNNAVKNIVKNSPLDIPEENRKWEITIGVYGRKDGSVVKKSNDVLYRMIVNIGDPEIYNLSGSEFNNEPVVLPNGYALLMSPLSITDLDIKVYSNPVRKNINPKIAKFVSKIRPRKYMRTTIVLDLLYPH